MTLDVTTIVLILTTIAGLSSSVIMAVKAKPEKDKITKETEKLDADAVQVLSSSAVALLQPMRDQMRDLELRLQMANRRASELEGQLEATTVELRSATKTLEEARTRGNELEELTDRLLRELRHYRDGDVI